VSPFQLAARLSATADFPTLVPKALEPHLATPISRDADEPVVGIEALMQCDVTGLESPLELFEAASLPQTLPGFAGTRQHDVPRQGRPRAGRPLSCPAVVPEYARPLLSSSSGPFVLAPCIHWVGGKSIWTPAPAVGRNPSPGLVIVGTDLTGT